MVVGIWNRLPAEVVEVDTITACKRYVDRYMDKNGLKGYGQMWTNGMSLDEASWLELMSSDEGLVSMLYGSMRRNLFCSEL